MLKALQKVIDKIETLQESNAKMQFALRHLMGINENVSVGDVAVVKSGFEKKKKKKKQMKEQNKAEPVLDTDKRGKKVVVTPDGKTKPLTPAQQKEMERN